MSCVTDGCRTATPRHVSSSRLIHGIYMHWSTWHIHWSDWHTQIVGSQPYLVVCKYSPQAPGIHHHSDSPAGTRIAEPSTHLHRASGSVGISQCPVRPQCHSRLLLDTAVPMMDVTHPAVSALDQCDVHHRSRVPEVGLFVRHSATLAGDRSLLLRLRANNALRDFETQAFWEHTRGDNTPRRHCCGLCLDVFTTHGGLFYMSCEIMKEY